MSAFIHKLLEVGVGQAKEFWNNNGDDIIEAGQSMWETVKDGAESLIEKTGEVLATIDGPVSDFPFDI